MESLNSNSQERELDQLQQMQDKTFKATMLLNLDQLEKHLAKEEFQELEYFNAFRYFIAYTKTDVPLFHATLIQHLESLKELILERAKHKRGYDKRVNDRTMQSKEGKVDSSKAFNASLVVTKCSGTESDKQDTSIKSRNDITHAMDADSKPNDQVPFAEVLETINIELEHSVAKLLAENEKLHKENKHLKRTYKDLYDSIKKTLVQTKDHNDSSIAQINSKTVENADLKAQIQEKVFANVALRNELRKLKGNNMDTMFAKPSILGKSILQPPRNQSVVRQPNAFKSERPNFSKPRFASHVDVNNILSKPVTPHYLPKVIEYVFVKRHYVITFRSSRNSSKELCGSHDMAHNYYLEEAKKKTQDKNMNLKPSVMHTTSLQNTTNGSKPKPRSNNQTSRTLPVSKSSCRMSKDGSKGYRISSNKSSTVHEKPNTSRSCLRWKPTSRIFKTASLRWIPTGKMFTDSTTMVDNEPLNGSNEDITNPYVCEQTLNVSASTLNLSASTSFNPKEERLRVWLLKKLMSKNQVPQGIHKQEQSLNSAQGVKEQQQRAYFDDPCHEI
ncbi:hypothetical protein Tco_0851421 [Tanacetum coccineum]